MYEYLNSGFLNSRQAGEDEFSGGKFIHSVGLDRGFRGLLVERYLKPSIALHID